MKKTSRSQIIITFVPPVFILGLIAVVTHFFHIRVPRMTMDPLALAHLHPLTGFLSNLGMTLWAATVAICLFSAVLLRPKQTGRTGWFLLYSGLLSAYLLFDDLFQFHEALAKQFFGLNEKFIYAALGLATLTYALVFRKVIARTNCGFLLFALGFLAFSVAVDAVLEPWFMYRLGQWKFLCEDGAKWLGIACWCSYFVQTSYQFVMEAYHAPGVIAAE
jgi:hypothetical protein